MRTLRLLTIAMATTLLAVSSLAQTSADRSNMEQALRSFFQNYGNGYSGFPVTASLSGIDVDNNSRVIKITATERFASPKPITAMT